MALIVLNDGFNVRVAAGPEKSVNMQITEIEGYPNLDLLFPFHQDTAQAMWKKIGEILGMPTIEVAGNDDLREEVKKHGPS